MTCASSLRELPSPANYARTARYEHQPEGWTTAGNRMRTSVRHVRTGGTTTPRRSRYQTQLPNARRRAIPFRLRWHRQTTGSPKTNPFNSLRRGECDVGCDSEQPYCPMMINRLDLPTSRKPIELPYPPAAGLQWLRWG